MPIVPNFLWWEECRVRINMLKAFKLFKNECEQSQYFSVTCKGALSLSYCVTLWMPQYTYSSVLLLNCKRLPHCSQCKNAQSQHSISLFQQKETQPMQPTFMKVHNTKHVAFSWGGLFLPVPAQHLLWTSMEVAVGDESLAIKCKHFILVLICRLHHRLY